MRMALVKVALATAAGVVTLAACGSANDGYDPSIATGLEYVNGNGQTGNVGDLLSDPLTVKVTNFVGDPVTGATVQWYAVSGGGSVSTGTTTTDENGLAQVSWVLGPVAGSQKVQAVASLNGSPVSFAATARTGPPDEGGGGAEPIRTR